MTNVYKINLFSFYVHDEKHLDEKGNPLDRRQEYKDYCKSNNKLGWGWPRHTPKIVTTLKEYKEDYGKSRSLTIACNQIKDMKPGDLCWSYISSKWYLGKVIGDFIFSTPSADYPEFGMYRGCKWHEISNSDLVPGIICAYSKKEATVLHISENTNFAAYCNALFNNWENLENIQNTLKGELDFWEVAHTDDLEDLVGLYLQKHGYYIFPSTNKQGTKDYEFKLIRTDGEKEAVIQCKNNADIPWETLEGYTKEDIYVLSVKETKGAGHSRTMLSKEKCSENWDMGWESKDERIKMFDAKKLEAWARDNQHILPKRIQNFLKLSEKYK